MANEILDFTARARDEASGNINRIRQSIVALTKTQGDLAAHSKQFQSMGKELLGLSNVTQQLPKQQKYIAEYTKQWKEMRVQLGDAGTAIMRDMVPALGKLAAGSISAGAATEALIKTVDGFIEQSRKLGNMQRATGFQIPFISSLENLGERLDISKDQIGSFLTYMNKSMLQLATPQGGALFQNIAMTYGLQKFGQQMRAIATDPSTNQAQKSIRGTMAAIDEFRELSLRLGSQKATAILTQLGFGAEIERFAKYTGPQLREELNRIARMQRADLFNPEAAHKYAEAWGDLQANLTGVKNVIGAGLIGDMSSLVRTISDYVAANQQQIGDGIVNSLHNLRDALKELKPLLDVGNEVASILNAIVSAGNKAGRRLHGGKGPGQTGSGWQTALARQGVVPMTDDMVLGMQNYSAGWPGAGGRGAPTAAPAAAGGGGGFWATGIGQWSDLLHGRPRRPWGGTPAATQPAQLGGSPISFAPGSLGTGSITAGMRRSTNVEDMRPIAEQIADERSRRGEEDNTASTRDNTDQLRKLIDILQRSTPFAPTMGGFGGGGTGAYGQGQGPMFRPGGPGGKGIGPGAAKGRTAAATSPVYSPPKETLGHVPPPPPGAKVTPGPTGGVLTQPPASSIPSKENLPSMQDGGVVKAKPGGTIVVIGEGGQDEAVVPLGGNRPQSEGVGPNRYQNPGSMAFNSAAGRYFGSTSNTQIGGNPQDYIADFPTPVLGAASNMFLLSTSSRYLGQTIAAGQKNWAPAANRSLPGFDPNTIVTPELIHNEDFVVKFMKSTAKLEGFNTEMSDADWHSAFLRKEAALDREAKGLPAPNPGGAEGFVAGRPYQGSIGGAGPTPSQVTAPTGVWPKYPGVLTAQEPTRLGPDGKPITGGRTDLGPSPVHHGMELQYGDRTFNVGSGGEPGKIDPATGQLYNSIPYGTYTITPGANGQVISRLGGMTLQNNAFLDPVRNRMTGGIAIHPNRTMGQENTTEGCVGFDPADWNALKPGLQADLKQQGTMYLNVNKDGAKISSTGEAYTPHDANGVPLTSDRLWNAFGKEPWSPVQKGPVTGFVRPELRSQAQPYPQQSLAFPAASYGGVAPEPAGTSKPPPIVAKPEPPAVSGAAAFDAAKAGPPQKPEGAAAFNAAKAAGIPSHQHGAMNVDGGLAYLHKGEMVVPREHAEQIRGEAPGGYGGGQTDPTINLYQRSAQNRADLWAAAKKWYPGRLAKAASMRSPEESLATIQGARNKPDLAVQLGVHDIPSHAHGVLDFMGGGGGIGGLGGFAQQGLGMLESKIPQLGQLSGLAEEAIHKVEGSGFLKVDVNAPRGTNVAAGVTGLFNKVQLNRRFSMPWADQHSAPEQRG